MYQPPILDHAVDTTQSIDRDIPLHVVRAELSLHSRLKQVGRVQLKGKVFRDHRSSLLMDINHFTGIEMSYVTFSLMVYAVFKKTRTSRRETGYSLLGTDFVHAHFEY